MNLQDLVSLQSIKTMLENVGIDGDLTNFAVMAILAVLITFKTLTYLKKGTSLVWGKMFPGDPIVEEIVAALRGQRGEVVWNPTHKEILTEKLTVFVTLDADGGLDSVSSLKSNGKFHPLRLISRSGRQQIYKAAKYAIQSHLDRENAVAREEFLQSVKTAPKKA
jgi:hypothetical protein